MILYNFLRMLLHIPIRIMMLFSSKKSEFLKKRLIQNFDFLKSEKSYIWLHCSSVGEINLSDALIKKLLEREENILISVFTDTGYATALKKYSDEKKIKLIYFPLDSKKEINKILSNINLKLLILIETEIWPNLIDLVFKKKAKIILVNGRISDRSFDKYLKFKNLLKESLDRIDKFYMQTQLDEKRIIAIGAEKDKTKVVGNLKFDIELTNYSFAEKEELKKIIKLNGRKLFVAGSTRTGEDEIILETFKKLENYLLILVPRHLERIPKIEKLLKEEKIDYSKYSDLLEKKIPESSVIIVDIMGALRKFYAISDVAFVGGTLVNIGGHSLLEPLFYRKSPIFGKYLQNVKDISDEILRRGIGYKVLDADDMFLAIQKISSSEINEKEIDNFFLENSKVADKILEDLNY